MELFDVRYYINKIDRNITEYSSPVGLLWDDPWSHIYSSPAQMWDENISHTDGSDVGPGTVGGIIPSHGNPTHQEV